MLQNLVRAKSGTLVSDELLVAYKRNLKRILISRQTIMLFSISSYLAIALSLAQGSVASNHFAGLAVSNSINSGSYTCRTQGQVRELTEINYI